MTDYLPKFTPGRSVTLQASAAVTGGSLVALSGGRTVAPAGADSAAVVGVAGFDAGAGEDVTVFLRGGGGHRLTAAGEILVGTQVISAAGGAVASMGAEGENPIGTALTGAASAGERVEVLLVGVG
jgi:hypothetical protein